MATKKTKPSPDDLPRCEDCRAGEFDKGNPIGDCRLFPMDWHVVNDEMVARYKPAYSKGYCLHFVRRVN